MCNVLGGHAPRFKKALAYLACVDQEVVLFEEANALLFERIAEDILEARYPHVQVPLIMELKFAAESLRRHQEAAQRELFIIRSAIKALRDDQCNSHQG